MKTHYESCKETVHTIEFTEAQLAVLGTIVKDDIECAAWNDCDYSDPWLMGFLKDRADVFQMLKKVLK